MCLQHLLVVHDEARALDFVHQDGCVLLTSVSSKVWVLRMLHAHHQGPLVAEQGAAQASLACSRRAVKDKLVGTVGQVDVGGMCVGQLLTNMGTAWCKPRCNDQLNFKWT